MTQEALKLAIQLRDTASGYWTENEIPIIEKLIELLAQPKQEQEPVVWMYQDKSTHEVKFQKHMRGFVDHGATYETPLYTTPPQRKPLTNAEIRKWWASENGFEDCNMAKLDDFEQVIRAVEGKHGIKE